MTRVIIILHNAASWQHCRDIVFMLSRDIQHLRCGNILRAPINSTGVGFRAYYFQSSGCLRWTPRCPQPGTMPHHSTPATNGRVRFWKQSEFVEFPAGYARETHTTNGKHHGESKLLVSPYGNGGFKGLTLDRINLDTPSRGGVQFLYWKLTSVFVNEWQSVLDSQSRVVHDLRPGNWWWWWWWWWWGVGWELILHR